MCSSCISRLLSRGLLRRFICAVRRVQMMQTRSQPIHRTYGRQIKRPIANHPHQHAVTVRFHPRARWSQSKRRNLACARRQRRYLLLNPIIQRQRHLEFRSLGLISHAFHVFHVIRSIGRSQRVLSRVQRPRSVRQPLKARKSVDRSFDAFARLCSLPHASDVLTRAHLK